MITVLAGGVGAARFLQGVIQVVPQKEVVVIGNTGDDRAFYGLHVSPDLDIVTYTLAGVVNEQFGWGIQDDTLHAMQQLTRFGYENWFTLGDTDLATHIYRTDMLRQGKRLSEITQLICQAFGLDIRLLPMTDDTVTTFIKTPHGSIHFQEYMVKHKTADEVVGRELRGIESVMPAPGVIMSIEQADAVLLAPSNPIVSIGTILAVPGVKDALQKTKATIIAVSPIVGGKTIKGPADKIMRGLGLEPSARGVAEYYKDFLDVMVIDAADEGLKNDIEVLGIHVIVTNTIMRDLVAKKQLAEMVLQAIHWKYEMGHRG